MSELTAKQRVRVVGDMWTGMVGTITRVGDFTGRYNNPYAVALDGYREPLRELWFRADELEPIPEPRP